MTSNILEIHDGGHSTHTLCATLDGGYCNPMFESQHENQNIGLSKKLVELFNALPEEERERLLKLEKITHNS